MRVIVCGGRKFSDRAKVNAVLDSILDQHYQEPMCVVQGGASGADELARDWCAINSIECKTYAADWKKYGRAAGPKRNQQMLIEETPDLVVVFKGGRGTADMVRRAEANRTKVKYVEHIPAISHPQ